MITTPQGIWVKGELSGWKNRLAWWLAAHTHWFWKRQLKRGTITREDFSFVTASFEGQIDMVTDDFVERLRKRGLPEGGIQYRSLGLAPEYLQTDEKALYELIIRLVSDRSLAILTKCGLVETHFSGMEEGRELKQ